MSSSWRRHRGVKASIKFAHSVNVNALSACCVTSRCLAMDGMSLVLRRTPVVSSGCVIGRIPGVLFLVTRRCRRGVFLRARFAVGFRASMIAGASDIRWIVNIGASSITLCSASRRSMFTLCSSIGSGGFKIRSMRWRRRFRRRRPLVVVPAGWAHSVNSSVSARKC